MEKTGGDFKKRIIRDEPLPSIKDIEREMDKDESFNHEYFTSKEQIKKAKQTDVM